MIELQRCAVARRAPSQRRRCVPAPRTVASRASDDRPRACPCSHDRRAVRPHLTGRRGRDDRDAESLRPHGAGTAARSVLRPRSPRRPELRVVERMTAHGDFRKYVFVLDAGGGLGGVARWLTLTYGCRVLVLDVLPAPARDRDAGSRRARGSATRHRRRRQLRGHPGPRRHLHADLERRGPAPRARIAGARSASSFACCARAARSRCTRSSAAPTPFP